MDDKNHAARIRIGQRIAQIRQEKGLTQEELAAGVDMQQSSIVRIELGKFNVTFDILERIAHHLGTKVDFINL